MGFILKLLTGCLLHILFTALIGAAVILGVAIFLWYNYRSALN